jgi:hypothetical protein
VVSVVQHFLRGCLPGKSVLVLQLLLVQQLLLLLDVLLLLLLQLPAHHT